MPPPWRIAWSFAARAGLRAIPWKDAAAVDAAVMQFAAGEGGSFVRHRSEPSTVYLRVLGYRIRLAVDEADGLITVVYVWRRDP
jgi:hypothetical protein